MPWISHIHLGFMRWAESQKKMNFAFALLQIEYGTDVRNFMNIHHSSKKYISTDQNRELRGVVMA